MKSQLFAGISHEFKTPLNIILSSLDLLRMKSQQENPALYESSYAKYMNYAYENCFKLLRLATNLLDAVSYTHLSQPQWSLTLTARPLGNKMTCSFAPEGGKEQVILFGSLSISAAHPSSGRPP